MNTATDFVHYFFWDYNIELKKNWNTQINNIKKSRLIIKIDC